jgi:hypothetical protein
VVTSLSTGSPWYEDKSGHGIYHMKNLLRRVEYKEYMARRAGKEVNVKEGHGFFVKRLFDDNSRDELNEAIEREIEELDSEDEDENKEQPEPRIVISRCDVPGSTSIIKELLFGGDVRREGKETYDPTKDCKLNGEHK